MSSFDDLPYATKQRLLFIEVLLKHSGEVTRASIADMFGIGVATATRDIRLYRQLFPDQLTLNRKSGRWSKSVSFEITLTNKEL